MKDVFIILPGPSLNKVTEEEKEYIKSRPVISTGLYIFFWELFGVKPNHFLKIGPPWDIPFRTHILDSEGRSKTLKAMGEVIDYHNMNLTFYCNSQNARYLKGGQALCPSEIPYYHNLSDYDFLKRYCRERISPCSNFKFKIVNIDAEEIPSYGLSPVKNTWAESLQDKFFFGSSVSTAINLATVLYPNTNIKLLGNDGGKVDYFYSTMKSPKQLSLYGKELFDVARNSAGSHNHYNSSNNQYPVNFLISKVKKTGNLLFNCSRSSIFSTTYNLDCETSLSFDKDTKKNMGKMTYSNIIP